MKCFVCGKEVDTVEYIHSTGGFYRQIFYPLDRSKTYICAAPFNKPPGKLPGKNDTAELNKFIANLNDVARTLSSAFMCGVAVTSTEADVVMLCSWGSGIVIYTGEKPLKKVKPDITVDLVDGNIRNIVSLLFTGAITKEVEKKEERR